jgi:hypothetical protein
MKLIVAQLGRALTPHVEGRKFESRLIVPSPSDRHLKVRFTGLLIMTIKTEVLYHGSD